MAAMTFMPLITPYTLPPHPLGLNQDRVSRLPSSAWQQGGSFLSILRAWLLILLGGMECSRFLCHQRRRAAIGKELVLLEGFHVRCDAGPVLQSVSISLIYSQTLDTWIPCTQ